MKKFLMIVFVSFFSFSYVQCGDESGDGSGDGGSNFFNLRWLVGGLVGPEQKEYHAPFGGSHVWGAVCSQQDGQYKECWPLDKIAKLALERFSGNPYASGTGHPPSVLAECKQDEGLTFAMVVGGIAATGVVYYGAKKFLDFYRSRSSKKSSQLQPETLQLEEIIKPNLRHRETDLDAVTGNQ